MPIKPRTFCSLKCNFCSSLICRERAVTRLLLASRRVWRLSSHVWLTIAVHRQCHARRRARASGCAYTYPHALGAILPAAKICLQLLGKLTADRVLHKPLRAATFLRAPACRSISCSTLQLTALRGRDRSWTSGRQGVDETSRGAMSICHARPVTKRQ